MRFSSDVYAELEDNPKIVESVGSAKGYLIIFAPTTRKLCILKEILFLVLFTAVKLV